MSTDIKETVRARYANAALRAEENGGKQMSCCGGVESSCDPISGNLYSDEEKTGLPGKAIVASLGCGNPTAMAQLEMGEVVLDLGSGGGIDVLLSAKRVGPTGKAYGLDMTDEMLELARTNLKESDVENVEFLKGEIEDIPLPDNTVDVIISNCVINLSADKTKAMKEAFRVLKPGGRLAISDIVSQGTIPDSIRKDMHLWTGCIAGALDEEQFKEILLEVGFEDPSLEATRVYQFDDALQFLGTTDSAEVLAREIDGRFAGAFIRATKPLA
jgi:arsenite methyltransferase